MTCDTCGKELQVGDWAWCPHGRSNAAVIPDDVPGGFWAENGFERPMQFYSHSAHEQALAERGKEIRAKWAGPNDKHLKPWHTVDLDAAKALLERGAQMRREQNDRIAAAQREFPITVTDVRYERP